MIASMPALHLKQDEIRRSVARFMVLSCGRRFGKTLLAAVLAFACAISGGAVWWIGPTSREANIGWKKILPMAQQIPGVQVKASLHEIHFPGGGWIAVLSAENTTLRGEGLDLIIIDEAAYLANLEGVWLGDLRAALSDRQGRAVFISTPDGRTYFHDLYLLGQDAEEPEWASWQLPTADNPFIAREEIEAARRTLPEWYFEQEYEAKFQSFTGKVYKSFGPGDTFTELDTYPEYYGGIDFGFTNPTVACVAGVNRDDRMDVIDGIHQSGLTTPELVDIIKGYHDKYKVKRWFADPADPDAIAQLRAAGLPVVPAPRVKGSLERSSIKAGIVKVETRLVNGLLRIHAGCPPEYVTELDGYRYPPTKGEREVKETPLKVHDHFPDALRYMVVGVDHLRGHMPQVRVAMG